jgi:hypothetical protein
MIQYVGSGIIKLSPCFQASSAAYITYKWIPGDIVFFKPKAKKGILEKIVIKKVRIISKYSLGGQKVFLYEDTYNSLYNEDELITEADAILLAEAYYQLMIAQALEAKKFCNFSK